MDNYQNPPLVEIVCEVFYSMGKAWDVALPGTFYKKIDDAFPIIEAKPHGFEITLGPGGNIYQPIDKNVTQYYNKDRSALLQLAPGMFCVNKLAPFSNYQWSDLWSLFINNYKIFNTVIKPDKIQRLGLRYINRIDIGEKHSYDLIKKYVNYYPNIPSDLPQEANSMNILSEIKYEKGRDLLAMRLATLAGDSERKAPVLIELSYNMMVPGVINNKNINAWFSKARDTCRVAFESIITEEARSTFNNI